MTKAFGRNGLLDHCRRLLPTSGPKQNQKPYNEQGDNKGDRRQRTPAAAIGILATDFHGPTFFATAGLSDPAGIFQDGVSRGRDGKTRFARRVDACIAALVMQRNRKYKAIPCDRSLVLVGMMGVGKSTIGRRLAARLGIAFTDADEEIEKAAGMSIQDIFDRFGEAHFRDGERRVIARLFQGEPKVIATGGGAFVNDETRALILEQATAIWLNAELDVLVDRVSRRDGRPLLKGRDPRMVLSDLMALRDPLYAQAPIHIQSAVTPHEATVDKIIKAISCN